jgi:cyclopropane-fatty-acyl-phospholipid synthase
MNETATAPPLSSSGATPPSTFYQSLLLRLFATLTEGRLHLELPDGSVREFGRSDSAVSARISVRNPAFFQKCVLYGDVGFGESYVDGDWETNSIERVISWAIANVNHLPSMSGSKVHTLFFNLLKGCNQLQHWLRPNSLATSRRNIAEHYDLGNAFYSIWLDPSLTYSSARYTAPGQSLENAQFSKYDALCQKLRLQTSDHVLEIGTGWGGFSLHAARHYGCRITTITISEEQFKLARQRFEEAGLADRIQILLQDYRHLSGSFDKIVSIEMMEALGDRYLQTYLSKLDQLLKPDGLIGLQFITVPDRRHAQLRRGVDWIQKHIFPGSLLLSLGRINEALNRTSEITLHELEDLGASYAKTLHVWWERFNAKLDAVAALGFDSRFIRKWNYYLQYCEAAFASRNISVVQAVYTRPNNPALHTAF